MFIRTIARPLLASWFVYDGVSAVLDPGPRAARSAPLVRPLLASTGVDVEVKRVVQAHGAATLIAATALAFSKTPRTSAFLLATLAAASVAAAEPYWLESDHDLREASREQFLKNVGLLGGTLIAATAGNASRRRTRDRSSSKRRA